MRKSVLKLGIIAVAGLTGLAVTGGTLAGQKRNLEVPACDGGAPVTVKGVTAGERLSPERAQEVADQLMSSWLSRQDQSIALAWARERDSALAVQKTSGGKTAEAAAPAAQETPPAPQPAVQATDLTARDFAIWERELAREIAYGDKVFHDDKEIGSPEGVSCAMCHPNASNTHPETYPKFQTQLKRVSLLRDMINWCIENPLRGKKLAADDPKMRALEAYILAQRKGVQIEPGKH